MTDTLVTTGEQVAETLHRLGYLIGQHHLPAPDELNIRMYAGVQVDVLLRGMDKLRRWSEVTDAAVTSTPAHDGYQYLACTVIGDRPLRLTAFGKALTP
jgi:hypothetical protein